MKLARRRAFPVTVALALCLLTTPLLAAPSEGEPREPVHELSAWSWMLDLWDAFLDRLPGSNAASVGANIGPAIDPAGDPPHGPPPPQGGPNGNGEGGGGSAGNGPGPG